MEYKYKATPMFRRPLTTSKIMLRLLIGLFIVYLFGLYNAYTWGIKYFYNGLLLLLVSVVVCCLTEAIYALCTKQKPMEYINKSFPVVTSLILVLIVPVNTSLYVIGIASFLGIFFGKLVYGGFGQNVFNPAAVARAIIVTTFSGVVALDAITSPTITTAFAGVDWLCDNASLIKLINDYGGLGSVLGGTYFGAMGETSTLLIILIGIYLSIVDVIDWHIPVTYLGVLFVGASVVALVKGLSILYPIVFVSTGGAVFGAVFMLTDPVTNPQTRPGKIVFSAIAALLTVLIRLLGNLPEGVVFSILIVNMLSPAIDKLFSVKQIDSIKRNIAIVFATIIVCISCVFFVGNSKVQNKYVSIDENPSFVKNQDYSINEAKVTDFGNGKYHVVVKGYGLLKAKNKSNYSMNEFDITIKDGKVIDIVCTKFGDTLSVGGIAVEEDYLSKVIGLTGRSNVIDACTGCSYTSDSILAAVQAALKEANK